MEETDDFVAETGIPVQSTILTETVAITTGETVTTTTTPGTPLYAGQSIPLSPETMLFIGTEEAIGGKLPKKSSEGHKLQVMVVPKNAGFNKFYDRGENSHIVMLLHRNTARFGEWDDPLGHFFNRVSLSRVSLVFMGENDQENFAALCELDPNIAALHEEGRVFFWDELHGITPRQKVDDLTQGIKESLGVAKKKLFPRAKGVRLTKKSTHWSLAKWQKLLAGLGGLALFLTVMCSLPPLSRDAKRIHVPGAEKWTPAERDTYLNALNTLERERRAVGAERQRIDMVRRKMIEKINDIEEIESTINREKRNIVCGLLERREQLLQEYISGEHALKHIGDLRREISRMESARLLLPVNSRQELELERSISEKKYDLRVWEEGLGEIKKVEEELARSDVFSWSSPAEYCEVPLIASAY